LRTEPEELASLKIVSKAASLKALGSMQQKSRRDDE